MSVSFRGYALCDRDSTPDQREMLWATMRREAVEAAERDGILSQAVAQAVLRHATLADGLAHRLAQKLGDEDLPQATLRPLFAETYERHPVALSGALFDLLAVRERDPACPDSITPFLFYKGFQALQAYRLMHALWRQGRTHLANHLQARVSIVFGLDIHPAARIGCGVMIDHGTGVVIGETAVVEDDVSILQAVTLGGTGKEHGDRHPKVRRGVLLGAGAKVLGNIEIGEGAKVGAGSIVLEDVAPHTTVVGVPARPVASNLTDLPAFTMDHSLPAPDYSI
jgi:serine O-acetyltransferase